MSEEPITVTAPTCAECGRPWVEPAERWRSRLTIDDQAAVFCPACDEREFAES